MSYQPTSHEREKCERLIEKVTAPEADYVKYLRASEIYHDRIAVSSCNRRRHSGETVTSSSLRKSKLFHGNRYLVAFLDDDWMARHAYGLDAMAAPASTLGSGLLTVPTPPLVYVPQNKCRARNLAFLSVLEHEFVHINQMLIGSLPHEGPSEPGIPGLSAYFLTRMRCEYEANFIQLARWPQRFKPESGFSLEHWCALRGYSQSLEHLFLNFDRFGLSSDTVIAFLEDLSDFIPEALADLGVPGDVAEWFQLRIEVHLEVALVHVSEALTGHDLPAGLSDVAAWLDRSARS